MHGLDVPAALRFPEASDWHGLLEMTPPLDASVAQAATGLSDDLWSRLVVLHPGNHGSANGWSVDRFQALGHRLTQAGCVVAVTGTEAERKALGSWLSESDVVDLVGKLDMPGLLGVLAHAKLCVASSTGPLHLASAFGTPVVGLYQAQACPLGALGARCGPGDAARSPRRRLGHFCSGRRGRGFRSVGLTTTDQRPRQPRHHHASLGLQSVLEHTAQCDHQSAPQGALHRPNRPHV